jgi:hypothetical protein
MAAAIDGYGQFGDWWGERARLAWGTIAMRPTAGIGSWMLHVMDVPLMEELTGNRPGSFACEPERVYLAFQRLAGACFIDQYIPRNPLTMGSHGFGAAAPRSATTGAERVVVDGMEIDSAEDVVEHMERFVFPARQREIEFYDPGDPLRIRRMVEAECAVQREFGPDLLKGPYGGGFQCFPYLHYTTYGYANYFSAYALYPEVMERDFAQQADLAALRNHAAARAIVEGGLPRLLRLDHDMADSRGTLVRVKTLDRFWLPHFARSVRPLLDAGVRLIWHCDGNLMQMVPRLIEAGVGGFQGFQYEDGMDYPAICRMGDRDGGPLLIVGGVSVTRTLPHGTRRDVREELRWLVENGPPLGLFLGATSSIVPGTKRENILELIEGLAYYRMRNSG